MARYFWLLSLCGVLGLTACGKNDPIVPVGSVPPPQAPPPPNYQPPSNPGQGYFPPGGQLPPDRVFRPQMPQGQPPQFTPFLPIDNYMRRNPGLSEYWGQFWWEWEQYARARRYHPYDFSRFWFEYCPEEWAGTELEPVYLYFDAHFYHWASPEMRFSNVTWDPSFFWSNCDFYPYPGGFAY